MSPVSRGRKPKWKNPRKTRKHIVPGTHEAAFDEVEKRLREAREPPALSGCVVQTPPGEDAVTLAATLTSGGRASGVEVFVIKEVAEEIDAYPMAGQPGARWRRTYPDLAESSLSPGEFRAQVEAALAAREDMDAWFAVHCRGHPAFERPGFAARVQALRRWLGLEPYVPVPRLADARLPMVLPEPGPPRGLQLAVSVRDIDPRIWRRLAVRADTSLAGLHRILAAAFERSPKWGSHVFHTDVGAFGPDDDRPDDAVTIDQVAPAPGRRFTYDLDDWEYAVRVERVLEALPPVPRCIAGARAAPPEECESARDYELLLEAMADPDDEDDEAILREVGIESGGFDPEWFEPEWINDGLRRLR